MGISDRDRYKDEVGLEALNRQTAEAENRYACCGELRVNGHHPVCRNYVETETPELIDGQETLL